jgi:hypothetical protein
MAETPRQSHLEGARYVLALNRKVCGCKEVRIGDPGKVYIHLSRLKEPISLAAPAHQVEGTKRKEIQGSN